MLFQDILKDCDFLECAFFCLLLSTLFSRLPIPIPAIRSPVGERWRFGHLRSEEMLVNKATIRMARSLAAPFMVDWNGDGLTVPGHEMPEMRNVAGAAARLRGEF